MLSKFRYIFFPVLLLISTMFTSRATTFALDSLALSADTLNLVDTIIKPKQNDGFLSNKVTYIATDSIVMDVENEKVYLYNHAVVEYEDMKLMAGFIELDLKNHLVNAKGIDSNGVISQIPVSIQGKDEFKAQEIRYDFETKKGKIKNVVTQQGDGYIHGDDIKKSKDNTYYIAKGRYTTCDLDHPHFYIGANKLKVIPNDKIVTGPAYLNIADVPTPLAIPFGYFPNKAGRASGILIPSYGESPVWGFFLKDGGFYFGSNEYIDLALTGDIYSNGSYAFKALSRYKKNYYRNGTFGIGYSKILDGDRAFFNTTERNDFFVNWTHNQDAKRKPNSRFSANLNAGTSSYNTFNGDVNSDYQSNTFQSNIAYSKKFVGTPFNFSLNARHSQNTITKKLDLSLPQVSFTMNRIYPFKRKGSVANKWSDKIGISATLNAKNDINTYDSLLFRSQTLDEMRNGLNLVVPITTSLTLLKYFKLNPSININSRGYFKTIDRNYDPLNSLVETDTVNGFRLATDYRFSAGLNTLLYGNYFFKTKRLKQIRHVMTPSVTASYRPDFSADKYGYYRTVTSDSLGNTQQYSIFQNGIYGSPPAGKSGVIGVSLNNTFEAKINAKTDTGMVSKKVKLIDNLNISTSYNLAADEFKWSPIRISGRTKLFNVLDINTQTTFDPYQLDSAGIRTDILELKNSKKIGRLTSSTSSLSFRLTSKKQNRTETKNDEKEKETEVTPQTLEYLRSHPEAFVDFNIPWSLYVSYNINYRKPLRDETITQTATFSGDVSLSPKWKFSVRSGYDFTAKKLSLTQVNVYRDLHCWEMSFTWVPFGLRQSFALNLNVKSSTLRDLKLTRKRAWQDFQ